MSERINIIWREEKELHRIAKDMADKDISIRLYDKLGNSEDTLRPPTEDEKKALEQVFFSAIWTLNRYSDCLTGDMVHMVKDMAEINGDSIIDNLNGFNSVYTPLSEYVDEAIKEAAEKEKKEVDADDKVIKYYFEYKLNAGVDISLSPEEAKEAKEGSLDLKDEVDDAVVDMDFGDVYFDDTGEYPEALELDSDDPYIHSRIYGTYMITATGNNIDECRKKARMAWEAADIGEFSEDSLEWEVAEETKIRADCEKLIACVETLSANLIKGEAAATTNDTVAAVNMDESGLIVVAKLYDAADKSVNLSFYSVDKDTYGDIYPITSQDSIDTIISSATPLTSVNNIPFEIFADTVRNISLDSQKIYVILEEISAKSELDKKTKTRDIKER